MPAYAEGSTGIIEDIFITDTRYSDGRGLTGLVYNSTGLTVSYHRYNAGSVVTHAAVTMTLGTHVDWGFKETDATAQPGVYSLGIPDALFAATFKGASILLFGGPNMVPVPLRIDLASGTSSTATARAIPGQVTPPTTLSPEEAIMYLYKLATQPKEQDQVSLRIYDTTHTTVQQKQPLVQADETLVSFDRMVSGP